MIFMCCCLFFFFKQKTAYEMRISDWSSDVCSSDLLDQAEARRQAIATELKPLYDAFNTARNAANPNQASLNTQAQTIRQREEAGKQELARLQQPAARAQGYSLEQLSAHLDKAVQTVVGQKQVNLLLPPEAAFFEQPPRHLTHAIPTPHH